MKLTKEEHAMLDGQYGDVPRKAMELLIAVGECYDAEQLVSVASAHLAPANPVNCGKGGTRFLKDMAERGGKFVIPVTTNPACVEPWAWREMGFSETVHREQLALSGTIAAMGGFLGHTCTPYLIGHVPRLREHIAWSESSAVVYANAVLGSRTNREGAPTVLAAGITGRTPAYGYHLDENRYGKLKVIVNVPPKGETEYATLGYFAGRVAQDRVPVFLGIPQSVSQDELKCLGAALATSGSVSHFHVVRVTPEAPTEEAACGSRKIGPSDTHEFGSRELKETEQAISKIEADQADVVVLGCPHASIGQIRTYAQGLSEKRVRSRVEVWILVSHPIKKYAEDMGYARIIESAGARLVSNTGPCAMPRDFFKTHGYGAMATDSPKMAYYASATQDVRCFYGDLEKILEATTERKV